MPEEEFYEELIQYIKAKKPSKEVLSKYKNKLCLKHNITAIPTDIQIFLHADKKDVSVKKYLQTKPVRTMSGVSVIAIMSKPRQCPHGSCTMCPAKVSDGVPKSYTGEEPATRRAIRNNFDPYLQVFNRLEQYVVSGHNFDKIELIVMGGTFLDFPASYKESFVAYALKALNDFAKMFFNSRNELDFEKFKAFFLLPGDIEDPKRADIIRERVLKLKKKGSASLARMHAENDKTSLIKCIGLTVETRPDYGKLKHGNELLGLGCTRVELGVQSVYDHVLKRIRRGHTVKDTIESIRTLKDLGFKLNFHYMLGLPGINKRGEFKGLIEIFKNKDYKPDMLKLYPCVVVKDSKLYKDYQAGKYKPISLQTAVELLARFKKFVPKYCRIMRVQRDIPSFMIEAGVDKTNLRQYVHEYMQRHGWRCSCIRCKEISNKKKIGKLFLKRMHYPSSYGTEYFISAETKEALVGFCRLRMPSRNLRKEITKDSALVRELHVYGPAERIGESGENMQHRGLGKQLMKIAEDTARENDKNKVVVISGIGVRGYYRNLGYSLEGPYMTKKI